MPIHETAAGAGGVKPQSLRVGAAYRRLLRRAATVGWEVARIEYLPQEVALGRGRAEVLEELAYFDTLHRAATARRLDPVTAQRRRDLFERRVLPLAVLGGTGVVLAHALEGTPVGEALAAAVLTTASVGLLGRVLILSRGQ